MCPDPKLLHIMSTLFNSNKTIVRTVKRIPDGFMSGVHFEPRDAPVRLVFLHANGFNALSYRTILETLGVQCVSLDLRGHGFTRLPAKINGLATFHTYVQDVTAYSGTFFSNDKSSNNNRRVTKNIRALNRSQCRFAKG